MSSSNQVRRPKRSQPSACSQPKGSLYLSSTRSNLYQLALPALTLTCALVFGSSQARAQATPTAIGPGSYLSVGLAASAFQQDYGQRYVGGETLFVDANLYRKYGAEFEVRRLNFHTSEDVKENTYMGGIKYSIRPHHLRPYVKLLAGEGTFQYPFHYAHGSYFVVAPAAGLDWHIKDSRWTIRAVDFQYQIWPDFSYGQLHPYGFTSGVSFDVFNPGTRLYGRHFRH